MINPCALKPPFVENRRRVLGSATFISLGLHGILLCFLPAFLPFSLPGASHDSGVIVDLAVTMQVAASEAMAKRDPGSPEPAQPEKRLTDEDNPRPTQPEKRKAEKKPAKKPASAPGRARSTASTTSASQNTLVNAPQGRTMPPALAQGAQRQPPVYPELARKRGQEGTVNVRCQIDSSGNITGMAIARSSGFRLLDEAALKAVAKWKFEPGKKDGSNVAGVVIVPVRFQLQN